MLPLPYPQYLVNNILNNLHIIYKCSKFAKEIINNNFINSQYGKE